MRLWRDKVHPTTDASNYSALKLVNKQSGKVLKVANGEIMGRTEGKNPFVTDHEMSREHLQFIFEQDKWFVKDLKSRNGVFLNNQRIPPGVNVPIKSQDDLRFGKQAFKATVAGFSEPAPIVKESKEPEPVAPPPPPMARASGVAGSSLRAAKTWDWSVFVAILANLPWLVKVLPQSVNGWASVSRKLASVHSPRETAHGIVIIAFFTLMPLLVMIVPPTIQHFCTSTFAKKWPLKCLMIIVNSAIGLGIPIGMAELLELLTF
jgi:hypothetical protein